MMIWISEVCLFENVRLCNFDSGG